MNKRRTILVAIGIILGWFVGSFLIGCQSTQLNDNLQLMKGITDAAKSGNVAGTLKVHIVGAAEAYQHLGFGIGNPNTVIDADLQFKFNENNIKK